MRFRVFVFTFILGTCGGYALSSSFAPTWRIVAFSSVAMCLVVGALMCSAALRCLRWPTRIALVMLVAVVSGTYGAILELRFPTRVAAWIGVPIYIQGTVISIQPKPGGVSMHVAISRITPAQTSARTRTCQVTATWWMTGRAGAVLLHQGDSVTGYGMLAVPPLVGSSGQPVRAELAKAGIYYSFDGRLVRATAANSMFHSTLLELTKTLAAVHAGNSAQQALLLSIVFGGSNLDSQTKQTFMAAGLLHVLAASGANVVLLTGFAEWGTRPIRRGLHVPDRVWALVLVSVIWWFAGMCGFAPSITRAAWMATYQYTARACRRTVGIAQSLLFAGAAMCAQSPVAVLSISSLLSFGATAAVARAVSRPMRRASPQIKGTSSGTIGRRSQPIGHLVRWVAARIQWILWHAWITLRQTFLVEIVVSPLALSAFGQLTPYSIVSNLVAEPLLVLLLPASALFMAIAALSSIAPVLGTFTRGFGSCVYALIGALQWLVGLVSQFPFAIVTLNGGIGQFAAVGFGCIAAVFFVPKHLRAYGIRMCRKYGRFMCRRSRSFQSKSSERVIK